MPPSKHELPPNLPKGAESIVVTKSQECLCSAFAIYKNYPTESKSGYDESADCLNLVNVVAVEYCDTSCADLSRAHLFKIGSCLRFRSKLEALMKLTWNANPVRKQ